MPPAAPVLEGFAVLHPLRVRWAEVDAQGIVFNAHYLLYFDLAITEYMRAVDSLPFSARTFLVHSTLDYRRPARFDDELTVAARITALGRTSFHVRLAVFRGADVLVDGTNIYAHAIGDPPTPTPLPAMFIARVHDLERVPPATIQPASPAS